MALCSNLVLVRELFLHSETQKASQRREQKERKEKITEKCKPEVLGVVLMNILPF